MATIDRSGFSFNADLGGHGGGVVLGGRRFDVFVKAWDGDWEAAWGKAEQGAELFLDRFPEIEAAVASQLAPELDHWTDEPVTVAEITERVVRAMHGTAVVSLHANEESASLFFDGPALGTTSRWRCAETGRCLSGWRGSAEPISWPTCQERAR